MHTQIIVFFAVQYAAFCLEGKTFVKELLVVTGPVLEYSPMKIKSNNPGLYIPNLFFKAVLNPKDSAVQEKSAESAIDIAAFFIPGVKPVSDTALLKNACNTAMFNAQKLSACKAVVGTVMGISTSESGGVTLFLDHPMPYNAVQVFIQSEIVSKLTGTLALENLHGQVVRVEGIFLKNGKNLKTNTDQFKVVVKDLKSVTVVR